MSKIHLLSCVATAAVAIAFGVTESSCMSTECGVGTIDKDGTCVPADDMPGSANCAPGTVLKNGRCENTVVCGDNTMAVTDPVTMITTCVGTGGGNKDCSQAISCSLPSTGRMTICGRLVDVETNVPLIATGAMGATCNPLAPSADGPCSLTVTPYDAVAFANDPTTSPPLPADEILLDDCGRFRLKSVNPSGAQFIGLGIENAPTATKDHRRTGIAMPTQAGKAVQGIPGYAVRNTTDQKWSTAAGFTTPTFVQRGVYMAIFLHGPVPVSGVKISISGTGVDAPNDYYFSDASPASRATIDTSLSATGANGAGLLLGHPKSLVPYTGTGGEPTNCKWPSDLGDQIPDVAFIQPRIAVLTSMTTTACP